MQENGELKDLKIARGVKDATHSQFVDDSIMLGVASTLNEERFKEVLSSFLKASDGNANSIKYNVYGWNCAPRMLTRIARVLGFEGKLI